MQKDKHAGLEGALLALAMEKRKEGRKKASFAPFLWLLGAGVAISLCSYALFDEDMAVGNFAVAGSFFSELAEENEAIAVFLGLDEER